MTSGDPMLARPLAYIFQNRVPSLLHLSLSKVSADSLLSSSSSSSSSSFLLLFIMEGNDWDLFAVVRGCRGCGEKSASGTAEVEMYPFVPPSAIQMNPSVPLLDTASTQGRSGFEELEEFLMPFFSKRLPPPQQLLLQQQQQQQQQASTSSMPLQAAEVEPTIRAPRPANRPRRRKPQQKKVVCQVPADSVSADVWAWRKYGQKPIKGSPYPRGYYRCSSSKGCLARKQMERSRADPETFIITYTAEHNHPVPTHRNSLAGSTRHKVPSSGDHPPPPPPPAAAAAELSPTTPLTASTSTEEEEEEEEEEGMLLVEDMEVIGEDEFLIMGDTSAEAPANGWTANLADFDDDDIGFEFLSQPWLCSNSGNNAATAAGGGS